VNSLEYIIPLVVGCFYAVCLGIVFTAGYRLITHKTISVRLCIATILATQLLMLVLRGIFLGGEDINPHIQSREQLVGLYSHENQSLRLKADGTFEARGLFEKLSGNWSHRDWNLTLSGTGLVKSRIITHNGRLCIAPFYGGVDATRGVVLEKQDD
jgi:hypothetical protein